MKGKASNAKVNWATPAMCLAMLCPHHIWPRALLEELVALIVPDSGLFLRHATLAGMTMSSLRS